MANLKSLVKDTVIYGMSSILGRFLNYLLVPLYTIKMAVASGGYGVVTNIYAYTALLLVILTFGMETTFFRYVNKEGENPERLFHNAHRCGVGGSALCGPRVGLFNSHFICVGICFNATVCLGYGSLCGN